MTAEPLNLSPTLTSTELATLADELVHDTAPRLFAVVQSYEPGDRDPGGADARVAAWGMAFEEGAEVVSVDSGCRMRVCSLERVVRMFGRGADVSARVVWVAPAT
ncbi:hypothetical protein [Streptomyces paludis]|uniref:Uncharacterized protein n=1 Tax=Streptomyces paludis TaxID=2282738 RepID=A0A345I1K3_9ACTN|nr:hypothetical protein [Streptomyces paludis]AXG82827.1 hypothetical protein DVK44_22490 [Streptomyces paludis]